MQYLNLEQKQQASQYQLQSSAILQMNTVELASYLQALSLENPVIELHDTMLQISSLLEKPQDNSPAVYDETSWQYNSYVANSGESSDPIAFVMSDGGLSETLYSFLTRQLPSNKYDTQTEQAVCYLAACLDDDGYLRIPLQELAEGSVFSEDDLQTALSILQSLEPAGVGASSLSECLVLQLQRIGGQKHSISIVTNCLEQLSLGNIRSIAKKCHLEEADVLHAQQVIRSLDPRPGAVFQKSIPIPYSYPDFFVEQQNGLLTVRSAWDDSTPFHISRYYQDLLNISTDPEVRTYLTEKLQQAQAVLRSFSQRNFILKSCMDFLLERQKNFFLYGPDHLCPLMMTTVAESLNISVSTVSRAMRMKCLQCTYGTFPLSFFFPKGISSNSNNSVSTISAHAILRRIIDAEDKSHPQSDQNLVVSMAQHGCSISRRTIAKYREELGIPNASLRRQKA